MSALEAPPLAVYLHFPWCVRKCPYCDFNSFTLHDTLPEAAYVAALKADIAAQAPALAGRPVVSVFLGGGTPSLFSPQAIGDVLAALHALLPLAPGAEVTLEANPATVERGRFAEYRAAGITRVSLGAQSFDPAILKVLGRIHVPADVTRGAEELHASGLANFNLDLMFALPGQTREGARDDLRTALALEPAHLSHYQLTMEPGTVFAAQPPPGLPDEELAWTLQEDCHAELAARGYAQYEVSAFARTGRQCVHNLNYWRFGDYLGAGEGRHLVLHIAAGGELGVAVLLQRPGEFVVGQSRRRLRGEHGAGLHRELVVRQVRGLQRQRGTQVGGRAGAGLAGQREHQVEVEVGQAAGVQLLGGARHVRRHMDAAEDLEDVRVEALGAERYAGHAGGTVLGEAATFDGGGVRLEGDFGAGCQGQQSVQNREDVPDRLRRKQAGRASAEEDADHRAACERWRLGGDVRLEGGHVGGFRQRVVQREGVEVAVRALAHAPREVEVDGERRRFE